MNAMQLLSGALVHFVWQGVLIAALTEVALTFTRDPRTRYSLACAGLAAMALAPILTLPFIGQSILGSPTVAVVGQLPVAPADWVVRAWTVGLSVLTVRLFVDQYRVSQLRRRSIAAPPGLQQMVAELIRDMALRVDVEVRIVAGLAGPVAVGILRPAVLLPASLLTGLTPEQMRAIVAHELAHIRRWDALVNLLQVFVETALYYHPAVWWISHRIRVEREFCCDEAVVATCGDPITYARALTDLEAGRSTLRLTQAAQGGHLMNRIKRIVGMPVESARPRWTLPALGAACALGMVSVALAGPADVDHEIEGEVLEWVDEDGEHHSPDDAHGVVMIKVGSIDCEGDEDCHEFHHDMTVDLDMDKLKEKALKAMKARFHGEDGDIELPKGAKMIVLTGDGEHDGDLNEVRDLLHEHGVELDELLEEGLQTAMDAAEDGDHEVIIKRHIEVIEEEDNDPID